MIEILESLITRLTIYLSKFRYYKTVNYDFESFLKNTF